MSHLSKQEKQALALFKGRVEAELAGKVDSLHLFGSKARGDATKHSDIDILAVMNDVSWERRLALTHIANEVLHETGVMLSLKKFTPQQMEEMRKRQSLFWRSVSANLITL